MPWLALLLIILWLLGRNGGRRRPRTTPPAQPSADPAFDDRAAASAWSSYVPEADAADPPRQADGGPRNPYDDVPDRSSGQVVDSDATPGHAYGEAERLVHDESDGPSYDESDDAVEEELAEAILDQETIQPGAGAVTDPADQPQVDTSDRPDVPEQDD